AREALASCAREPGRTELDRYYCLASEAEAFIVLGDTIRAFECLEHVARVGQKDLAARASTRRQLRRLLRVRKLDESILEPLAPPKVLHYCGHRFLATDETSGVAASAENRIRTQIAALLDKNGVGIAFGSLASGSDILFAEECIRRDIELNLVFPFAIDEFKAVSVAPAGQDWLGRFERCRAAAEGAMFATAGGDWGDEELFAYAGRLAMGLAALRSQYIDSEAIQIAVWDGLPARGRGGTAVDIEMWRATNRKTIDVPVERIAPNPAPPQASALPPHG